MAAPSGAPIGACALVTIRPIRDEADHRRALDRITAIFDASAGTPEADELEVLSQLVAAYERRSIPAPTPLDAIRFRLQQAGLGNRALEPLLGSRSRVSEIMSGERKLTVDMMRALHLHFGIPAEALLGTASEQPAARTKKVEEPSVRALADLVASGMMRSKERYAEFLQRALDLLPRGAPGLAHLRKTRTERTNAKTDGVALEAWCTAAMLKSLELTVRARPDGVVYDLAMGREIAALSSRADGPNAARAYLAERGIALVILGHLAGTYLDGAAMCRGDGVRIIALTLRYDRLDNFWFTLLHEFAHVACHLDEDTSMILDDLEIGSSEAIEQEADDFAQRALIPEHVWDEAKADLDAVGVTLLAGKAGVHPAIVAGRWQRQFRDYRRFSKLVGHGAVRRQFT